MSSAGRPDESLSSTFRVTDADREHFRVVARANREAEATHLREIMSLDPGRRMETALALSDLLLGSRPSPQREVVPSLSARWHELEARRRG